jgi:opacity protein-like surface antigen
MKRVISLGGVIAMALAVASTAVEAQSPIRFGLAGGVSFPTGEDADVVKTGYHGQLMLGFGVMALPVKLRADFSYQSFDGKDEPILRDANFRILGGAVNAIISMAGIGVKPYVTGGLGVYNAKLEVLGEEADETDLGLNGGLGLEFTLTGMSAFVEARYIHIFTAEEATQVIPLTFGILF